MWGGRVGIPDTIHYNSPQLSANCKLLSVDYSGAIPFMDGTHRMKDSEGQNSSEGKCPRMMKMFLGGKE